MTLFTLMISESQVFRSRAVECSRFVEDSEEFSDRSTLSCF
jgi:hypothetical protein